jgi:CMP-N,N'-diacetyllegionaminic acid synthase
MSVLALIPARSGSKGIPNKNLKRLAGRSLVQIAVDCAYAAECSPVVSTDYVWPTPNGMTSGPKWPWPAHCFTIHRPAELATDDTPMLAVVQHALEQVPGPDDQIIVLLQPTQPLRTAVHVQTAIARLRETQADSVVSVVDIGVRDQVLYSNHQGRLRHLADWQCFDTEPTRRQDQDRAYRRDGTCYAFRRETVTEYGTIYGHDVVPLIIPASESCELDTMADWAALEARFAQT